MIQTRVVYQISSTQKLKESIKNEIRIVGHAILHFPFTNLFIHINLWERINEYQIIMNLI